MKSKIIISLSAFILLLMPFGYAQSFVHNIEEAKTTSSEKDQPILMIFSGSDWCKPCIQLKETVISNQDFAAFAADNLVLLELDFPYKRKNRLPKEQQTHNEKLAEKYNPKGQFPMMVLVNADGSMITEVDYNNRLTAKEYVKLIQSKTQTSKQLKDRRSPN